MHPHLMENLLNQFNDAMTHPVIRIGVIISGAVGVIAAVAGGFYTVYQLVTLIGAS